jgi:hypothetical protein
MKGAAVMRLKGGAAMRRQDGQVVPLVMLAMVVLIGFGGLVIDLGRVRVAQRQLQNAVDSAALAAGLDFPSATTAYNDALSHSATGTNGLSGFGVTVGSPSVTFECDSLAIPYTAPTGSSTIPTCMTDTSGKNCQPDSSEAPRPSNVTTCNAVNVQETATVNTTFLGVFRHSFTITASSTAAARGGSETDLDIDVILDATTSMTGGTGESSGACASITREDCAKLGVQTLLQTLWPCNSDQASCTTTNAVDEVGVLAIPAMDLPSTTVDTTAGTTELAEELLCKPPPNSTGDKNNLGDILDNMSFEYPPVNPPTDTTAAVSTIADYQMAKLGFDYRPPGTSTNLSTSSNDVQAMGCGDTTLSDWSGKDTSKQKSYSGISYDGIKDKGGAATYLAGAIDAASADLEKNARSGATNDIVILSDGGMSTNAKFTSGSASDIPCQDAVDAATYAQNTNNDSIYTIGYGDVGNKCGPDASGNWSSKSLNYTNASPAGDDAPTFLGALATPGDYKEVPANGDLTTVFHQLGEELTLPRLLTDCTPTNGGC